jgi:DNA polymerase alpha-associated DNA helicase A
MATTLFDRLLKLHGSSIKRALNVQYRMHEKIMRFPSDAMYGGSLIAADGVKARKLSDLDGVQPDEELDEPVVFIDSLSYFVLCIKCLDSRSCICVPFSGWRKHVRAH